MADRDSRGSRDGGSAASLTVFRPFAPKEINICRLRKENRNVSYSSNQIEAWRIHRLLAAKILKLIGNRELLISEWHIVKESIDARDKKHIRLVYSVDFTAVYKKNPKKQARLAANPKLKLEEAPNLVYVPAVYEGETCAAEDENRTEEPSTPRSFRENRSGIKENENRAEEPLPPARQNAKPEQKLQQDKNLPTSQTETPQPRSGMPEPLPSARVLRDRPIIVGFGPAGMFAALILAQAGLRPLVLERGQEVDARTASVERFWREGTLNEQSNVQFGEGGAGTFSDGKLTTGIKDARIRKVLEEFVAAGAPKEILYKQKPHIGTDVLRLVVKIFVKKSSVSAERYGLIRWWRTCVWRTGASAV